MPEPYAFFLFLCVLSFFFVIFFFFFFPFCGEICEWNSLFDEMGLLDHHVQNSGDDRPSSSQTAALLRLYFCWQPQTMALFEVTSLTNGSISFSLCKQSRPLCMCAFVHLISSLSTRRWTERWHGLCWNQSMRNRARPSSVAAATQNSRLRTWSSAVRAISSAASAF